MLLLKSRYLNSAVFGNADAVSFPKALASVAAIAHAGIRSNRIDHGRVQADFSGELIQRRKSYPSKFKSYLSNMQFIRDKDDYTENSVSKEIAERMGILHFRRKVVDTFGNTMFP